MLNECAARANADIARMRDMVGKLTADRDVMVGLNGSYARREVTLGSDVDLFVLVSEESKSAAGAALLTKIKKELTQAGFKLASAGGIFDVPLAADTLCHLIGGLDDRTCISHVECLCFLKANGFMASIYSITPVTF